MFAERAVRRACLVAACGLPATVAASVAACAETEVVAPRGITEVDPRPLLAWRALPGVSQYRLRLEARIPNGRVVTSLDLRVPGTTFLPAAPLAGEEAVVKVRVTAACDVDDQSTIAEAPGTFLLRPSARCAPPADVQVQPGPALRVSWRPSGAMRTEAAMFSAADGRLLAREDSSGNTVAFDPPREPATLHLRHRCADAFSDPVYRVLAPAGR